MYLICCAQQRRVKRFVAVHVCQRQHQRPASCLRDAPVQHCVLIPSPKRHSKSVTAIERVLKSYASMQQIVTCLRSSFGTRRAAIAPACTKYFNDISSMPFVVRTTFAPAARIFSILSRVMSDSRSLIFSSSFGSLTSTCKRRTPCQQAGTAGARIENMVCVVSGRLVTLRRAPDLDAHVHALLL